MACVKNNLAPLPRSMAFQIIDGRFAWVGEVDVTADALLEPAGGKSETAVDEAENFLLDVLAEGARPAIDIEKDARDAGVAPRTLKRGKERLGIKPQRQGFGKDGRWVWSIESARGAKADVRKTVASFGGDSPQKDGEEATNPKMPF